MLSLANDIGRLGGLTEAQAAARLEAEGPNELPTAKPRNLLATAWDIVREPMILLLLGAGGIYLVLGELKDALVLLVSIFLVLGISLYQERKTERALEALRDLSSPRALVIRDGQQRRIAGREVVRGDVVVLFEGDRVPADGVVLSVGNLSVDESLLTGESAPVRKAPWDGRSPMGRPGGDDLPFVFSGTMVVQGQGIAEIKAIGTNTELGKIGKALETLTPEETRLQVQVNRLVGILAILGLSVCAAIAAIYGLTRGSWIDGFLVGITAAMSLLPEEFPVVLTVFLALGAWRISQRRVLTRRSNAIETLGSATVLCVDKTGTLTQNRMAVQRLFAGGEFFDVKAKTDALPEQFHELLEYSILASKRNPFDPMEIAFQQFGALYLADTEHLHPDWQLVHEYPLSRKLLAMSRMWKPAGGGYVVAAKGAPEAIAELCRLSPRETDEVKARASQMAAQSLRILGVAKGEWDTTTPLPEHQRQLRFQFVGLVGLADPIREEVPAALQECYGAGIRVVMITGDYPVTAQHIAQRIGMRAAERVLTGAEIQNMGDAELTKRVQSTNIFARVVPEQKLRLVNALKATGEIVAMTGDGVNDAPALKSAQIGIAMGGRGTDVAREAADLVLLDDSFTSIVAAIGLGRRIFDNLRKAMAFVFAVHVPIAGLALIPVIFKWPLIFMPVHVLFLELIIDPACSIAFEAEPGEPGLMQRPPRDPREPLLSRQLLLLSFFQGVSVLLVVLAVFAITLYRGETATNARALTFATLVVANLMLILTNRSWTRIIVATLRAPNVALWWVVGGAVAVLALVIYVPWLRSLFRFSVLHLLDVGICLAAGVASLLWFEAWKVLRSRAAAPARHSC
ncbi:MAG: cation-translocating P-type ATPase [Terriglobales bacterium]